jgi:hypothetical protein
MKKSRYPESQIVKILNEVEGGRLVKEVCRDRTLDEVRDLTQTRSVDTMKNGHMPPWKILRLGDIWLNMLRKIY